MIVEFDHVELLGNSRIRFRGRHRGEGYYLTAVQQEGGSIEISAWTFLGSEESIPKDIRAAALARAAQAFAEEELAVRK